jgi:hypothetical protein
MIDPEGTKHLAFQIIKECGIDLLMYAFGCLFQMTGWLSPSMSLLLHTFTHPGWFAAAGALFGLGSAR